MILNLYMFYSAPEQWRMDSTSKEDLGWGINIMYDN